MKIYSMTATFGKLEHQTLTLYPGMNIIAAGNEWGKSTWCAFLTAMLYGLDTRAKSSKSALADKERYAPWSGAPMSGRIDLNWDGRDITIERSTKGRVPMGDFQAYETRSGLPVTELDGQNCGEMLLGVERSVFLRSGFIRQSDMNVTDDEALRRRLNNLVTTGDENSAADGLALRLREMKNRIRKLKFQLWRHKGVDIVISHAPPEGLGDAEDNAHRGFAAFREFIDEYHPKYWIHGHVHMNYGVQNRVLEYNGTKIINAIERYVLDLSEETSQERGECHV